jgi:hypothetical protein
MGTPGELPDIFFGPLWQKIGEGKTEKVDRNSDTFFSVLRMITEMPVYEQ